ncbi:hypothetical protein OnM2_076045 [Erysiphe neolycopersici]|uniref:Uncharacterized protein n=1 Tax=Erysiphe neolycopersici TaxID=212602 RepID=A0A420HIE2_9PEZI|nr:hypothetical protein OnM2_076045 [Erysiphe neolycopersici]
MFANQIWSRKRHREEAEQCIRGFGEHRTKRQNSANSQQIFPNLNLNIQNSSSYVANLNWSSPCKIAPKNEDLYADSSQILSERCLMPQVSSLSTETILQSSPITPFFDSEELSPDLYMTRDTRNSLLSDTEKYDTMHFSPGLVYHDVSTTTCSRIPTPIYSSFTYFRRNNVFHKNINEIKSENVQKKVDLATKLPSPISEEDMSPSIIVAGLNDMQMSVDSSVQINNGRKGEYKMMPFHSKSGFKSMTNHVSGNPNLDEIKKSFSMGYRANCEKCKMKVPGHFSHIIMS